MSGLPEVSMETVEEVKYEMLRGEGCDFIADILQETSNTNVLVVEFIAGMAGRSDDRGMVVSSCLLVYRMLEVQAEKDAAE